MKCFHSAHDLGFALEALSTSSGSQLNTGIDFPVSAAEKSAKTANRVPVAWLVAIAFGVVSIIALLYAWQLRGSQKQQLAFRQLNFRREAIFQAGKWVLAVIPSKPPQLVAYPTGAGETRRFDRANLENYASAQWFRDGKSVLIGGNEPDKGTRFYVQNISGGAPRTVTPEGTRDGRLSPDGKLILARGSGGKYFLYQIDGGEPRPVPRLTDTDVVIQWSADGRFWFTYQGSAIPCRVERVNVETGRREPFTEMAPANRTGLLAVRPNFITDNQQSYAYTTYQQVSSLFVTEGTNGVR